MSYLHLRVIVNVNEAEDQYENNDFWGLYLAFEEPGALSFSFFLSLCAYLCAEDQYMDRHDLVDGNVVKAVRPADGAPSVQHQGLNEPGDGSDVTDFNAQFKANGNSYSAFCRVIWTHIC